MLTFRRRFIQEKTRVKHYRKLIPLLMLLCYSAVLAQENICEAIVEDAINIVQNECAPTDRNQACYGYVQLEATPREGVENFTFSQAGDIANVADLDTLRLSALDEENNTWGIALMKLQANLPASLPGQNVTFVMFGNVEIQNAVEPSEELATIEIIANDGINVRSGPSTDYRVAGSLARNEAVTANGRNEDGSWLRIQVPDSDALGWVFAELVTTDDDTSTLSVVDAGDSEVPFTPMQAFYFSTGIGTTNCTEAPPDGILVQTPEGAGRIELRANDVNIQLGSTAFLQAEAGEDLTVSVVEGEGVITSDGVSVVVPAGAQVEVPLDDDLSADGPPGDPQPYDLDTMEPLPIDMLPVEITVAEPAEEEDIEQSNSDHSGPPPVMPDGTHSTGNLPPELSMFAGMDQALICSTFDQTLGQAGMTRQSYIDQLNQVRGFIPADAQQQVDQFIAMLNACG
jgi:hypothetical protein